MLTPDTFSYDAAIAEENLTKYITSQLPNDFIPEAYNIEQVHVQKLGVAIKANLFIMQWASMKEKISAKASIIDNFHTNTPTREDIILTPQLTVPISNVSTQSSQLFSTFLKRYFPHMNTTSIPLCAQNFQNLYCEDFSQHDGYGITYDVSNPTYIVKNVYTCHIFSGKKGCTSIIYHNP